MAETVMPGEADNRPSLDIIHPYKSYRLNRRLIERENCWDKVPELIKVHKEKLDLLQKMEEIGTDDKPRLKRLAERITGKEFRLQELWGFSRDATFHDWYKVPHCECPKMDNADAKGTKYGVITTTCPVHGSE